MDAQTAHSRWFGSNEFMKTQTSRVVTLAILSASLWFCVGCNQQIAAADESPAGDALLQADAVQPEDSAAAPESAPSAASATNAVEARLVKPAELPENLKFSPPVKEVVKLVQAGVSEDVILAYVTNAAQPFNLSSDEIVYLNDLGVSTELMASLLQRDASNRQVAGAPSLPPDLALNTPATNIYAPSAIKEAPLTPPSYVTAEQPAPVATDPYFYDSLAPYGNWVEVADYGVCWQPTVAIVNTSWRPYCDRGRWLWSDSGWYWYSDYSWGWAPFHYGRWCSAPRLGWFWVPDRVWGPSWVTWRYTHDYCGWAPLPPRTHAVAGFGLSFGGGAVGISFGFGFGPDHYPWVPIRHLADPALSRHFVSRSEARSLYNRSTVINNYVIHNNTTVINEGIGRDRVTRMTGTAIPTVKLVDASVPSTTTARAERIARSGSTVVVSRARISGEAKVPLTPPRDEIARPATGGRRVGSTTVAGSFAGPASTARPATVLPTRPQTTVESRTSIPSLRHNEGPATRSTVSRPNNSPVIVTGAPRTQESPASPQAAPADKSYVFGPRTFTQGNPGSPSTSSGGQRPASSMVIGKSVTPLPPLAPSSSSTAPNNSQATRPGPAPQPNYWRQTTPSGSIVINRDNAVPRQAAPGSSTISRLVGSPSASRPQPLPSWMRNETDTPISRPAVPSTAAPSAVSGFRPDVSRAPAGRAEVARPSAPTYSPPAVSVAPPVRVAPAAPVYRSEPARSYSAPAVSAPAPSAPVHSQSAAPAARSEGRSSGGSGNGGNGRNRGNH